MQWKPLDLDVPQPSPALESRIIIRSARSKERRRMGAVGAVCASAFVVSMGLQYYQQQKEEHVRSALALFSVEDNISGIEYASHLDRISQIEGN